MTRLPLVALALATLLSVCLTTCTPAAQEGTARYDDCVVFLFGWALDSPDDVGRLVTLLDTAAQHGYNAAVLPGFDDITRASAEYLAGLARVREACERNGIEIIPSLFGTGYGSALGHNRNLAEGFPVKDAPFVVQGSEARLASDSTAVIPNGGFEQHNGDTFSGFGFQDGPGTVSFVDTEVRHGGSASLRIENPQASAANGNARISLPVTLKPYRCYRVRAWVRTEGLERAGSFRLPALSDNHDLDPRTFGLEATADWQQVTMVFNSMESVQVNLYAGIWGGGAGKLWIDDWTIEEIGPMNVLRRPGTPVKVTSVDGATVYDEGKDYARLEDLGLHPWSVDREPIPLRIPEGSRIQEGQRLLVSWYHPVVIYASQVGACMAEPEMYTIWEQEARRTAELLHPKRYLMNMDEVREGGTCAACAGKDMAKLLGECITKGYDILRTVSPGTEVYIWSDMLDPNHNARGDYYLVRGDYTGSWRYVPKALRVALWGGPRPESLRFFTEEGFKVLISGYYDAPDLKGTEEWLALTDLCPDVNGYMYTTWERKYELMAGFGDLVTGRVK